MHQDVATLTKSSEELIHKRIETEAAWKSEFDNRIRLLTQKNIKWRKDGPISLKYDKQIKREFITLQRKTMLY